MFSNENWPLGFSATGINADLSFKKSKKDLALFLSHLPAQGAAVFTGNRVKAAPIIVTEKKLLKTRGRARAFLANSGSANAATGLDGIRDAQLTSRWVSEACGVPLNEVWVASTGVIGPRLQIAKFRKGIKKIASRIKRGHGMEGKLAAEAIMTTDTHPKWAHMRFNLGGVPVRVWGCAKGSGMIHPMLKGPHGKLHATMLSFILTDACVKAPVLQRALEWVADKTYNCVSIDGDTSTNDFVGVMANGASGSPELTSIHGTKYKKFRAALREICDSLTNMLARDGEGASRLVDIFVEGARSEESARRMASEIASSPLVKTACHGADPNWGRVLMALGCAGIPFDPKKVCIWIGDTLVCKSGLEIPFDEKRAISYMKGKHIVIRVDMGLGKKWSRYKTCDFTGHYVGINAGYRT
jgi:glutamate N-acetyltransferase/amino-acid N-acetyltransferase